MRCRSARRALIFMRRRWTLLSAASARHRFWPSHPAAEKSSRRSERCAVGIAVRHRIHDERHVITQIVSAARRRFHAGTRRNACQDDLRYATLAQDIIQASAQERAPSLLRDRVIAGLLLQFGNKLGPIGRKRKLGHSSIGAARSHARHVDKNHRQTPLAESARELAGPFDDFVRQDEPSENRQFLFAGRSRPGQRSYQFL